MPCTSEQPPPPSVVVVGVLDGVHCGHQALARHAMVVAANFGLRPVALTFDPHPAALLRPQSVPLRIEPLAQRLQRLAGLGLQVVTRPFDAALAALSPSAFAQAILVDTLGAEAVVVGADFRYGHGRSGDVHTLRQQLSRGGQALQVHALAPVPHAGAATSSTRVRQAVAAGELDLAAALLGRPWAWHAAAVPGAQRGGKMGFATANMLPDGGLSPPDGVYAVWARLHGVCLPAVANLGVAPTFGSNLGRRLEVHLIGQALPSLYGQHLCVAFVARLRPERRFADGQALMAQIASDVQAAAHTLRSPPPAATWACQAGSA